MLLIRSRISLSLILKFISNQIAKSNSMVIKIVLALGLVFTLHACATAQEGGSLLSLGGYSCIFIIDLPVDDGSAFRDEKKPLFYRGKNGVTVFCPAAQVGAKGIVDGVEYTKRDRSGLIDLASNKDTWNLLRYDVYL